MEKKASRARKTSIDPGKTPLAREFSAGGVVFKKGSKKSLWLVAKSAPSDLYPESYWRLPKGRLDDLDGDKPGPLARGERRASEEEIQKAALKEVQEEGGVDAKVVSKIGTEKYFFTLSGKRILKFVTFYLMEWKVDLTEGPGDETEETLWLSFEEARKILEHSGEKKILDKAREVLEAGMQESLE